MAKPVCRFPAPTPSPTATGWRTGSTRAGRAGRPRGVRARAPRRRWPIPGELGANAREIVERDFTWERYIDGAWDILSPGMGARAFVRDTAATRRDGTRPGSPRAAAAATSRSSTSSTRRRTAAATSSCSRSCGELERRGLAVEMNRHLGRDARPASTTRSTSTSGACAASRATECGWCTASTGRSASTAASTTAPTCASSRSTELADATILQSRYSLEKHAELGLELRDPVVIHNTVDPAIFHPPARREPHADALRVIATSWSDNPRKGADVLDVARPQPRPRRVRADVRREHAGARSNGSASSGRCRRSSSPTCCARTTCFSLRAATTRARTRCSKALACGLPAVFRPQRRTSRARRRARASGSTTRRSCPSVSRACATSSTQRRAAIQRARRSQTSPTATSTSLRGREALRRRRPARLVDRRRPCATRRDGAPPRHTTSARTRCCGSGAASRLPAQPLQRAAAALARVVAPARPQLLPRAARHGRLSGVRPRARRAATQRVAHRPRAGDARGDGGARASTRRRPREGVPDPDRHRPRALPPRRRGSRRLRGASSASRTPRSWSARSSRTASGWTRASSRSC